MNVVGMAIECGVDEEIQHDATVFAAKNDFEKVIEINKCVHDWVKLYGQKYLYNQLTALDEFNRKYYEKIF
jgi:hypothetical protein